MLIFLIMIRYRFIPPQSSLSSKLRIQEKFIVLFVMSEEGMERKKRTYFVIIMNTNKYESYAEEQVTYRRMGRRGEDSKENVAEIQLV